MTEEKRVSVIVGQVRRLLHKKRTANAIVVLTAHLEEHPDDQDAQELLGVCNFMSKHYEEALTAFQDLTRLAPNFASGWVNLGAVQNRMESTIANLLNVSQNISAARGRIVDADFAAETANLTNRSLS